MTTYTEFKDFYLREIWREGDTALIGDLDKLIQRAEARISRDLRHVNVAKTTTLEVSGRYTDLPGDFREIIFVKKGEHRLQLVTADEANLFLEPAVRTSAEGTVYWIDAGKKLGINLPDAFDPPQIVELSYFMGIAPYQANPARPFYDEHPDFYTAAVNVAVYSYLRDFDLSAEYNGQYDRLLESMRVESNYILFPSGQLNGVFPVSAVYRKRNTPVTPVNVWDDNGSWSD